MDKKTAFLSVSYQLRPQLTAEFETIVAVLAQFDVIPIDFVTQYPFDAGQEHKMMALVASLLHDATLLIAEVSDKAIGVGVEVGYAAALGLPVIYLRTAGAAYSTTVGGIANHTIVYADIDELERKLTTTLGEILGEKK